LIKKLGYLLLIATTAALAWWLLQLGFEQIQALRQLERVPSVQAAYVLPGEVTVNATARASGRSLSNAEGRSLSNVEGRSPGKASTALSHRVSGRSLSNAEGRSLSNAEGTTGSYFTQTPSLFYHYKRERYTTGQNGKENWRTEFVHTDGVDFLLEDDSGYVPVRIAGHATAVNWALRTSFSETRGDLRHTEWRLEPGDKVFVFAKGVREGDEMVLRFDQAGFFDPILSHYSQAKSQAGFGSAGLWALWGGLSALAIAIFALARLLNVHRIVVFASLLGIGQALLLVHVSLNMMHADLRNGLARYEQQRAAAEAQAENLFATRNLPWQGWGSLAHARLPPQDKQRLHAYQRYLALSQQRLQQQLQARPERWLLGFWQLTPPPPIEGLTAEDEVDIRAQLAALPGTQLGGLWWSWLALAAGALAAVALTLAAVRLAKVKRLIENLPHVPIRGISCGVTDTGGELVLVDDVALLHAPYSHTPCVWYSFLKEENRGSGKRPRWVTLEKEISSQPIYLQDSEGRIAVNAANAEIITRHRMVRHEGNLRYTEAILQAGDPIYTVALAAIDPTQPDRLHLRAGSRGEPFIISNEPEHRVMLRKAGASMLAICGAFSSLLLALLMLFGINGGFSALDFLAAAGAMPIYMILIMLLLHYNDLIFLRERALRNWANIDVALKKRKDLIDGFARTARAFLEHERSLQQKLGQVRAALTQTQNNQAKVAEYLRLEHQFQQTLSAVIESYPDLKGQQLMSKLMTVLSEGETEIALLRQGYNDAVTVYNTRIATVPDVVFAKLFHFRRLELIAEQ
jgi:hypothetical protein